jgi:hypothetical protein
MNLFISKLLVGTFYAMLALSLSLQGCGYHARSAVMKMPEGIQSLGIPVFQNLTNQYRLEQVITRSVLQEFASRTRLPVKPDSSGVDAVLSGEIHFVNATPVTFETDSQAAGTFGTTFQVTVRISAKLVRVKDSVVLWQMNDFHFRERYALNTRLHDFFSEENPALERLSRDLAASLASTVLNQKHRP